MFIGSRLPISCQGIGSCSTHAFVDLLSLLTRDNHGNPIPLSTDYILLQNFAENLLRRITSESTKTDKISQVLSSPNVMSTEVGAGFDTLLDLVSHRGAMPTSAWAPRQSVDDFLNSNGHFRALLSDVRFLLLASRYHSQIRSLRGEIGAGENFGFDSVIYRGDTSVLLRAHPELRGDLDRLLRSRDSLRNLVLTLIAEQMGSPLPSEFQVAGQSYTAQSFERGRIRAGNVELVEILKVDREMISIYEGSSLVEGEYTLGDFFTGISHLELERMITREIDSDHAVGIGVEWNNLTVQENGIMDWPEGRRVRGAAGMENHTTQIVGYQLAPDGRVQFYKVKNSWGAHSGDNGYYHMTPRFFNRFVGSVFLLRNSPTN